MEQKHYTWEQIAEALSNFGIELDSVRQKLDESAIEYMGRAKMYPETEGQEKLEPRAPAEKEWADKHDVQVFDPVPDALDGVNKTVENSPEGARPAVSFQRLRDMMK